MKLFISPHPDDETLFGAYTIQREKPLVIIVTHPTSQGKNGYERLLESYDAMRILGAPIAYLGIREDELTKYTLMKKLIRFYTEDLVYIPEKEGGNPHHDLVHDIAKEIFPNIKTYKTYKGTESRSIGTEVIPTEQELELKKQAMQCYVSQRFNKNTAHYFETTAEYE